MSKTNIRPTLDGIYEKEHSVQFYQSDSDILHSLKNFIGAGLKSGTPCVVIATAEHREQLALLLAVEGIDCTRPNYLVYDAEETLERIMLDGRINRVRFRSIIAGIMQQAMKTPGSIRAFGEMVALLWKRGQAGQALELEQLWNELARDFAFTLLCGYPASQFSDKSNWDECRGIGHLHTSVIAANVGAFA
jgi:hypothetical protein